MSSNITDVLFINITDRTSNFWQEVESGPGILQDCIFADDVVFFCVIWKKRERLISCIVDTVDDFNVQSHRRMSGVVDSLPNLNFHHELWHIWSGFIHYCAIASPHSRHQTCTAVQPGGDPGAQPGEIMSSSPKNWCKMGRCRRLLKNDGSSQNYFKFLFNYG